MLACYLEPCARVASQVQDSPACQSRWPVGFGRLDMGSHVATQASGNLSAGADHYSLN